MNAPLTAALFALCLAISTIDCRSLRIPNALNGALAALGLYGVAKGFLVAPFDAALGSASGLVVTLGVRHLYFRTQSLEALGLGDVKFVAAAGLWTGFSHFPLFLLISSLCGILCHLLMQRIWKRPSEQARIPFGPFLCLGLLLVTVL